MLLYVPLVNTHVYISVNITAKIDITEKITLQL